MAELKITSESVEKMTNAVMQALYTDRTCTGHSVHIVGNRTEIVLEFATSKIVVRLDQAAALDLATQIATAVLEIKRG